MHTRFDHGYHHVVGMEVDSDRPVLSLTNKYEKDKDGKQAVAYTIPTKPFARQ